MRIAEIPWAECVVPLEFTPEFFALHMDEVCYLRNLAVALSVASDVAALANDWTVVSKHGIQILDLANAVRRGGIVVDHLVSVVIAGTGTHCLRQARHNMSEWNLCELIVGLTRIDYEREPFAVIAQRDAKWVEETQYDQTESETPIEDIIDYDSDIPVEIQESVIRFIRELGDLPEWEQAALYSQADSRSLATLRLLTLELALSLHQKRFGEYPLSLSELVPTTLADMPSDPFTDAPFLYRRNGRSFVLYSTGPDQTDSGGNFGPWHAVADGGYDLCLDTDDY
ncbi:MAG: hypothetical protein KDA59_12630 [Planctomycetales bacterium]|nr:hypothetical protein [Planctomycetales bacterium]